MSSPSPAELWKRYQKYLCTVPSLGLTYDVSRMHFDEAFLAQMEPKMQKAFTAMDDLEKGAIANPDEKRMVGHYWLRAADMSPTKEIAKEITETLATIKSFAADVHSGKIKPPTAVKASGVPSRIATWFGVSARSLTMDVIDGEMRKLRRSRS